MTTPNQPAGYVSQFQKEDRLHTVGYYDPKGKWNAVSDHESYEDAANEVARLNGGHKGFTPEQIDQLAAALGPKLVGGAAPAGDQAGATQQQQHDARGMMREFVQLWDSVGIMGFACADQSKVPQLLAMVQKFKAAMG